MEFEVLAGHEKIEVNEELLASLEGLDFVPAVVTATKPDFYKQAPLIRAFEKVGLKPIVIHTGQHYDELLGFGLKEFNIEPYILANLRIRGNLLRKSYELIAKFGFLGKFLKERLRNTKIMPIVHGDTLVAGIAPIAWLFSRAEKVAHNEAGLRAMAPSFDFENFENFVELQWFKQWVIARQEPFPEQWDTFVASAGSSLFFAPVELNKQNLLREGYEEDRIFVVGNSIVDAVQQKLKEKPKQSVFDLYPELENDCWIRVDIHRRANLSERRFKAIVSGVLELVKKGYNVVWVELPGTRFALNKFNLRAKVLKEAERRDNFLFTGLWKYYAHVIEFISSEHFLAELTDSGSMQEELNYLSKPCLTVRFNTDRPETVFLAKSNLLVPPYSAGFFSRFIDFLVKQGYLDEMKKHKKKLYGKQVSLKIAKIVKKLLDSGDLSLMRTVPEVFGIFKDSSIEFL